MNSQPRGILTVYIEKADFGRDVCTLHKMSPYIVLQLGKVKKESFIARSMGQHPTWPGLKFELDVFLEMELKVTFYHHRDIGSDEELFQVKFDEQIKQFSVQQYQLQYMKKMAGVYYAHFQYKPLIALSPQQPIYQPPQQQQFNPQQQFYNPPQQYQQHNPLQQQYNPLNQQGAVYYDQYNQYILPGLQNQNHQQSYNQNLNPPQNYNQQQNQLGHSDSFQVYGNQQNDIQQQESKVLEFQGPNGQSLEYNSQGPSYQPTQYSDEHQMQLQGEQNSQGQYNSQGHQETKQPNYAKYNYPSLD